ncbi:hypothetical protein, partial [Hungatella effluvii]|uniref:hypothetical protein n=2 Tax=Hungatella TaxID=1649459 RepID=UPI0022E31659
IIWTKKKQPVLIFTGLCAGLPSLYKAPAGPCHTGAAVGTGHKNQEMIRNNLENWGWIYC